MDGYPSTVQEVIDDTMRFQTAALRAVRAFARSHPWRGSIDERKEKFRQLNHDLSVAYGIPEPEFVFGPIDGSSSGQSHYLRGEHRIVLKGRMSVVTYLHEFGHARGMGERGACRWSINLFKRVWPEQYARLIHVGHTLVQQQGTTS